MTGFVRPLNVKILENKIRDYGEVTLFFMDELRKYLFVGFSDSTAAAKCRDEFDGLQYPDNTRPKLQASFSTKDAAEKAKTPPVASNVKPVSTAAAAVKQATSQASGPRQVTQTMSASSSSSSSTSTSTSSARQMFVVNTATTTSTTTIETIAVAAVTAGTVQRGRGTFTDVPAVSSRGTGRHLNITVSRDEVIQEVKQPAPAPAPARVVSNSDETAKKIKEKPKMESLFRKTKVWPPIFYLPLTDEAASKQKQ